MYTKGEQLTPELSTICHDACLQALSVLMSVTEGDLRRAITLLQSASQLKCGEEITEEDFYNLAGVGTFKTAQLI